MDLETRRRRAAYRASHRGTKELDLLLGRYAEAHLSGMDIDGIEAFEQFLSLPDPELQRFIMSKDALGDARFLDLIASLRRFHGLKAHSDQSNE